MLSLKDRSVGFLQKKIYVEYLGTHDIFPKFQLQSMRDVLFRTSKNIGEIKTNAVKFEILYIALQQKFVLLDCFNY